MTDQPPTSLEAPDAARGADAGPLPAIYRRFRAQTFAQIVGQDAVVHTLRNGVRLERLGHGFLFVGPRGTGKTSMARILAKAVNCTDLRDGEPCDACSSCIAIREGRALDVIELDAASNNKVDDMRELVPRVYTAPADLRRKVFIIDEVQRIKEGWDVLLKTLEEPPPAVLFIFCTTDPSQIRPAVVSRLQRFTFRPLSVPEIEGKLHRILDAEGRAMEPAAVALIARMAGGGMRDAESMLDQVLVSADDPVSATSVADLLGLADAEAIEGFVAALVEGDVLAGMAILDDLEEEGRDLVAFGEQVVDRLRAALVERMTRSSPAARGAARPLAEAARRLTGIDASRAGLGGYRWQLELCLLGAAADVKSRAGRAGSEAARSGSVPHERRASTAEVTQDAHAHETAPAANALHVAPAAQALEVAPAAAAPSSLGGASALESASSMQGGGIEDADHDRGADGFEDADGIEGVRAAWSRIVETIGRNPANRPLVATCRPLEIRDGFLILGFPEDQAFMRDIAERKRITLEDGIAAVIGRPVAVRCVVANLELVPAVGSVGIDLVAQARRIFSGDLSGVEDID